ncbi:MAG: cytochrome d ubiquinol oxidase subunit II [Rhodospirillales bacterium]
MIDLPLIFALVIAFAIFMYVLMDGFSLGVGILFRFAPSDAHRNVMMNSTAPVWDGNQTWLVMGGVGLLAAFPLAYAVLLPALYLPLSVMLIALIFRGVAFEFRFKSEDYRHLWDLSFSLGSITATFAQGLSLGAFIQGIAVENRQFAGGAFDWLTPFSVMTGFALIFGYGLLGATWLVLKTENDIQNWAYRMALWLLASVIVCMGVVSLWTPLLNPAIADRWFSWPNILYLAPVPVAVAAAGFGLFWAILQRRHMAPFILAMSLFALGYLGLGISLWPYVVPPVYTIWDAAAAPESQAFLLVGVAVLIPVILGYTAYSYWVFRGKVKQDVGYH